MSAELPKLEIGEFPAAFQAMHGHPPYAWQVRLLCEVAARGWPETIAAPTGAGKTAVLDVALFHLALEANRPLRTAPLRIVLAVDRRIIVDQAFSRARDIRAKLLAALKQADGSELHCMATRLASLSGAGPLHVEQLRGGMPRENDWALRPDQPTILCTTVDQLGSRLLFRGYGVSPGMAPVHAGLLGQDALLILDEAHLSVPFAQTLKHITRRRVASKPLALPWHSTLLTATPKPGGMMFRLSDEERDEATIKRRLKAQKPTKLSEPESADDLPTWFARAAHSLAEELHKTGCAAPMVAIVVNRVALARSICDLLQADDETVLLTGRVRPAERDQLIEQHIKRLNGNSEGATAPLFVVATQCVEAGADFDFDGMVSQIAPLDALRQRFGRLARAGNKYGPAPGTILASKEDIAKAKPDPIYGDRMRLTWEWLKGLPSIDFGPDAMDEMIARDPDAAGNCATQSGDAPQLRQADVDFFTQTSPSPSPDPAPSLFLHGEFRTDADVSIIWRADLPEDSFVKGGDADRLADIVDLMPPRSGEALALPVWRARQWLAERRGKGTATTAQAGADILADIDTAQPKVLSERRDGATVLRWRGFGIEAPVLAIGADVRPGDTLVVPSSYGGCDRYGWAPEYKENVRDLADLAAKPYARHTASLRLHEGLWQDFAGDDAPGWDKIKPLLTAHPAPKALARALAALVTIKDAKTLLNQFAAKATKLENPYDVKTNDETPPSAMILVARRGLPGDDPDIAVGTPVTDGDYGSQGSASLALSDHIRDVRDMASGFAARLSLPQQLKNTIDKAAQWHDDGKADPRFQAYLKRSMEDAGPPLAKSGQRGGTPEDRKSRRDAGLPTHWRHEALSVSLAMAGFAAQPEIDIDRDLVLWLIGTHHGHGRPFFAHFDDWDGQARDIGADTLVGAPGPHRLDFDWQGHDWSDLFACLKRRYGVWGLAFLEALFRLADHRASGLAEDRAREAENGAQTEG